MIPGSKVRDRTAVERYNKFVERVGVVTRALDPEHVMVRWEGMEKSRRTRIVDLAPDNGETDGTVFANPFELTPPRQRLLDLLVKEGPLTVHEAAARLGVGAAAVSALRNTLRERCWVEEWRDWKEPMRITDEGLTVLRASP